MLIHINLIKEQSQFTPFEHLALRQLLLGINSPGKIKKRDFHVKCPYEQIVVTHTVGHVISINGINSTITLSHSLIAHLIGQSFRYRLHLILPKNKDLPPGCFGRPRFSGRIFELDANNDLNICDVRYIEKVIKGRPNEDDEEFLTRISREYHHLQFLFPDIPQPVIIRESDSNVYKAYLAVAYVEGKNLQQLFEEVQVNHLPPSTRRLIADLFLKVLASVHALGVVHGDVKPENIIAQVNEEDIQLQLIDWGLAFCKDCLTDGEKPSLGGTLEYAAPELFAGNPSTFARDIWSAAIVLLELYGILPTGIKSLGKHFFLRGSTSNILKPIYSGLAIKYLSSASNNNLGSLLAKMLALDPEQRPSMSACVEEMQQCQHGLDDIYWFVYELQTLIPRLSQPLTQLMQHIDIVINDIENDLLEDDITELQFEIYQRLFSIFTGDPIDVSATVLDQSAIIIYQWIILQMEEALAQESDQAFKETHIANMRTTLTRQQKFLPRLNDAHLTLVHAFIANRNFTRAESYITSVGILLDKLELTPLPEDFFNTLIKHPSPLRMLEFVLALVVMGCCDSISTANTHSLMRTATSINPWNSVLKEVVDILRSVQLTDLGQAISAGDLEKIGQLLQQSIPNESVGHCFTPFALAAYHGQIDSLQLLASRGEVPNQFDRLSDAEYNLFNQVILHTDIAWVIHHMKRAGILNNENYFKIMCINYLITIKGDDFFANVLRAWFEILGSKQFLDDFIFQAICSIIGDNYLKAQLFIHHALSIYLVAKVNLLPHEDVQKVMRDLREWFHKLGAEVGLYQKTLNMVIQILIVYSNSLKEVWNILLIGMGEPERFNEIVNSVIPTLATDFSTNTSSNMTTYPNSHSVFATGRNSTRDKKYPSATERMKRSNTDPTPVPLSPKIGSKRTFDYAP